MIIRSVKMKVFAPGNKKAMTLRTVAKAGHHFTAANIEKVLAEFVDKLDTAMPDKYRMVQTGRAEFNFVRIEKPLEPEPAGD